MNKTFALLLGLIGLASSAFSQAKLVEKQIADFEKLTSIQGITAEPWEKKLPIDCNEVSTLPSCMNSEYYRATLTKNSQKHISYYVFCGDQISRICRTTP